MILATFYDCIERAIIDDKLNEEIISPEPCLDLKGKLAGANLVIPAVPKPPKKHPFIELILNFSFYTNSEKLFQTDNGGKFTCLNGLRSMSMMWIIVSHTFRYLADYQYFFVFSKRNFLIIIFH